MERFSGLLGIALILGIAFLMSNNRKAISLRVVVSGLLLQLGLAIFILKTPLGQRIFGTLGQWVTKLLDFSDRGAEFVFGFLVKKEILDSVLGPGHSFVFIFKITKAHAF